jgi:hypothetical protein
MVERTHGANGARRSPRYREVIAADTVDERDDSSDREVGCLPAHERGDVDFLSPMCTAASAGVRPCSSSNLTG